jgi:hypothetical protein
MYRGLRADGVSIYIYIYYVKLTFVAYSGAIVMKLYYKLSGL